MTIKIGTIQEISGEGLEILVDQETRSFVLARFLNGQLMAATTAQSGSSDEPTLAAVLHEMASE
jgi:hypothetical protein